MSEKAHIMVVLYKLFSLFVKISICDALSSHNLFNDKWMCHALTQGIRIIIRYKSATAGKFITKKQVSSVECCDHSDEIKQLVKPKIPSINYSYFAKNLEFLL